MKRFALALASLVLLSSGAAHADELSDRVRAIYKHYEKDDATPPGPTVILKPMATKRLRALIEKDDACAEKEGVCNLGHDPIINAQDFKLSKVQIAPARIEGDKASVTARFLNMGGQNENRYEFIQEDGTWKLADLVTVLPKDLRSRLTEELAPKKRRR